jgi:hypothetical protein
MTQRGDSRATSGRCDVAAVVFEVGNALPGQTDGGRDRDRTCDPYHVKVVLYR